MTFLLLMLVLFIGIMIAKLALSKHLLEQNPNDKFAKAYRISSVFTAGVICYIVYALLKGTPV